ncbi:MAG: iron-containing alcohol dehydrogenase family protein [Lachnospiraceae bacterium]|nr:iron-containing alcohol dehydrogenase family protein [Lachnospiraceae bacterium]
MEHSKARFNEQFFPNYTVGTNAFERVPEICGTYGKKAIAIGGKRALAAAKPIVEEALKNSEIEIIQYAWYGGEASFENAETIMNLDKFKEAEMIFAFGGGKALDTCKYVACLTQKPIFTFPTIAGTCAAASSEAIMYYPSGVMRETYGTGKPALHIFINTQVIANAPKTYLWTGIGDTMSKHFETSLASRGKELKHGEALGVEMAKMCYKPLIKYGHKALEDCEKHVASFELEQICLCVIVTTGLVSGLINVTLNSSIAHSLFYGMTVLPQIEKNHLHGEVVSYGVLLLLIYDNQMEQLTELYPFYKSIGLPTKLEDIEVKYSELDKVMDKCLDVEDIHNTPYIVTKEKLLEAISFLEEYN